MNNYTLFFIYLSNYIITLIITKESCVTHEVPITGQHVHIYDIIAQLKT